MSVDLAVSNHGPAAPVLLTRADYLGTLAAARALGAAGITVWVADHHTLATTRWSRHVSRALRCPDLERQPMVFLRWLLDNGARHPGAVLCATSDDLAWLMATHREALLKSYRLCLPPFSSVYALLNKWKLYEHCVALHIDVPRTFLASGPEATTRIRQVASYPVIVKPQTQAFLQPHQKGRLAAGPEELAPALADFQHSTAYAQMVLHQDPRAAAPVVQEFITGAVGGVYNLSGFIDRTGELFVVEASRKLLQWPLRLGVGLCFEEVDVMPQLARAVAKLCRVVGYYGAFEVEFVPSGHRHMLIDFNPRFFGQMGFDVSRGLNLPMLVYLAAAGHPHELQAAVGAAQRQVRHARARVYCNRVELEVVLSLLRMAGRLEEREYRKWRQWLRQHRNEQTDPLIDGDDWLPAALGGLAAVLARVAHPRSTWRAAREW
ncbi:MAG: carbamoyl-phosphate synthase [Myxococcaceae bacterium]|nr:carbamoyl-phosphate synthase [Myxococcaceae bacterium]